MNNMFSRLRRICMLSQMKPVLVLRYQFTYQPKYTLQESCDITEEIFKTNFFYYFVDTFHPRTFQVTRIVPIEII